MNSSVKCLLLALLEALAGGCLHVRTAAKVDVQGPIHAITTRHRYRVVWKCEGMEVDRTGMLKLHQPTVFDRDGFPVVVTASDRKSLGFASGEYAEGLQTLCYLVSLGMTPMFSSEETDESVAISLPSVSGCPIVGMSVGTKLDKAFSAWWPLACFLYPDESPYQQTCAHTVMSRHSYGFALFSVPENFSDDKKLWAYEIRAYGLASKLKELEDAGIITAGMVELYKLGKRKSDVMQQFNEGKIRREKTVSRTLQKKTTESRTRQPPYRLVCLVREENSDSSYRFTLELNGEPSVQTFFGIQNVFADEVRTAYQLEFPNADVTSLRIAVRPRLINGKIEGRAVVLTITPVSLVYDPLTRKGRISVKFDENQYAEAREWARKNIETLVRDKNIVIETGELPPPGRYLSGSERVADTPQGKVLEMEFKAE